jgi:hypothetical protein
MVITDQWGRRREAAGVARDTPSQLPDLGGQRVQVRVLAGLLLAVKQAPVDHHLKHPAGSGDQFDFAHPLGAERPQLRRQTGGPGFIVSHLAVLDGNAFDHTVKVPFPADGASGQEVG